MPEPNIRERTFQYAWRAVKLYEEVRRSRHSAGEVLGKQFLRSATSIGADVEEPLHAESKPDFVHKMSIARKEARLIQYWLRIIKGADVLTEKRLTTPLKKTDEVNNVLTSIILTAKRGCPP